MAKENAKKPFYKKWWVWLITLVVIFMIASNNDEDNTSNNAVDNASDVTETDDQVENIEVELTEKEKIERTVEQIVDEDFNGTTISQLLVNENLGLGDGSYIVLPHLVWDVKNRAGTTREMLEMYSDHLAAKLADYNVSEVTVFWEVPYHLEGNNSAKFNYERQGDGMAIGERWYAPVLRD
ncbi:hypothetical protein BC6307_20565 [Sutcliffiella cohnii]|uniref:Uncharacterized protein n=1 Tax=Sutcliffiella cohnii TaxID=33932 RepID=A0A223KVK4_9BACI|nr:hypothetical protein [Sutcliffiella cohnii]AST93490.1 hypothetical protein BC6307_20565 [Sutcliffiella cohnii]